MMKRLLFFAAAFFVVQLQVNAQQSQIGDVNSPLYHDGTSLTHQSIDPDVTLNMETNEATANRIELGFALDGIAKSKLYFDRSTNEFGLVNWGKSMIISNTSTSFNTGTVNIDPGQTARASLNLRSSYSQPSWRVRVHMDRVDDYRGAGVWIASSGEDQTEDDWFAGVPYTGGGYVIGYHETQPEYKANSKLLINKEGNVGIGVVNIGDFKLAVNGKIRAKEIKVQTGWSDFVFEDAYRLRPLSEVESFIEANGHLPEIPSAEEVEANRVNVGEMESKLLQKIEELTLYVIELEKRMKVLERENRSLKSDN